MRWAYLIVTLIFIYTTTMNIWERPEGLKVSCFFIATILLVSFISRATRSTELRITGVHLSKDASSILESARHQVIRVIPRKPTPPTSEDLVRVSRLVRSIYGLPATAKIVFFEVERTDASEFDQQLTVEGEKLGHHCILHARSPIVANSIAPL